MFVVSWLVTMLQVWWLLSMMIELFWDRLKECLERYEAISAAQQAFKSDLINAFQDDEVYNRIGADGKKKHYKN